MPEAWTKILQAGCVVTIFTGLALLVYLIIIFSTFLVKLFSML